ncbi:hypothetical protein OH492_15365 [Vibrio chagasii]|nr:hypothetical protein [Vibrio chagasii]
MNRKINKLTLLLPIAVSSALVGCSQSISKPATSSQTSLDALAFNANPANSQSQAAEVTGLTLVGSSIADAPFDTSQPGRQLIHVPISFMWLTLKLRKSMWLSMNADSAPTSGGSSSDSSIGRYSFWD